MNIKDTKKKYHVITYGCQMNRHESEKIEGMLASLGYTKADTAKEADVIAGEKVVADIFRNHGLDVAIDKGFQAGCITVRFHRWRLRQYRRGKEYQQDNQEF